MNKILFVLLSIAILIIAMLYVRYNNANIYVQELEQTLEINGIDIADTVGGSDAYSVYYKE